jgi:hypothetical protein
LDPASLAATQAKVASRQSALVAASGGLVVVDGPSVDAPTPVSAAPAFGPLTSSFTSYLVSGGDPTNVCTDGADEVAIDQGQSGTNRAVVANFNAYPGAPRTTPEYVWATAAQSGSWNGPNAETTSFTSKGDPTVTHSSYSNLTYFANNMSDGSGTQCMGIGASFWTGVTSASFTYPLQCLSLPRAVILPRAIAGLMAPSSTTTMAAITSGRPRVATTVST